MFGVMLWAQTELQTWFKLLFHSSSKTSRDKAGRTYFTFNSYFFWLFKIFEMLFPILFCWMLNSDKKWMKDELYDVYPLLIVWSRCILVYSATFLCNTTVHFSKKVFKVSLDLFKALPAPAAIAALLMNDYLRCTVAILNLNYLSSPSVGLSSNALSLLPCEQMCFEAYKEPQHWLNHLFRFHHLQGLVAMLTSFSQAPGAPWKDCVYPRCQIPRGGPVQSSHRCDSALLSQHIISFSFWLLLPSLLPTASPACICSLMLTLGKNVGVSWMCLTLIGCKY